MDERNECPKLINNTQSEITSVVIGNPVLLASETDTENIFKNSLDEQVN